MLTMLVILTSLFSARALDAMYSPGAGHAKAMTRARSLSPQTPKKLIKAKDVEPAHSYMKPTVSAELSALAKYVGLPYSQELVAYVMADGELAKRVIMLNFSSGMHNDSELATLKTALSKFKGKNKPSAGKVRHEEYKKSSQKKCAQDLSEQDIFGFDEEDFKPVSEPGSPQALYFPVPEETAISERRDASPVAVAGEPEVALPVGSIAAAQEMSPIAAWAMQEPEEQNVSAASSPSSTRASLGSPIETELPVAAYSMTSSSGAGTSGSENDENESPRGVIERSLHMHRIYNNARRYMDKMNARGDKIDQAEAASTVKDNFADHLLCCRRQS